MAHPEITTEPPFVMFELAGIFPPSVARTSIPEMVNTSGFVFPVIASCTLIKEFVTDNTETVLMSFPGAAEAIIVAEGLNAQPVGVFRLKVTAEPKAMSFTEPSVMTTLPSVVYAGTEALEAWSAVMFAPPVAFVMVTVATEFKLKNKINVNNMNNGRACFTNLNAISALVKINFFIGWQNKGNWFLISTRSTMNCLAGNAKNTKL